MSNRNRTLLNDYSCFFTTTACYDHLHLLDRQENMNILIDQINYYLEKYHAELLGYVLMPNHIHLINYFKEQNYLSDFMRGVKRYSSKLIANEIEHYQPELISNISYKHRKQNKKIWNDRFHD